MATTNNTKVTNMLFLDIETTLAHDTIWCVGVRLNGVVSSFTDSTGLQALIDSVEHVAGHNIIGFDAPVLSRVWGVTIPEHKLVDTLVLSRLYDPSIEGGHSLAAWGTRLGFAKGDFTDYDGGYCEAMMDYCHRDVALTERLYHHLTRLLNNEGYSEECRTLEHEVARIIEQQVRNGFLFDRTAALSLQFDLQVRAEEIEGVLRETFKPTLAEAYSIKTKKPLKILPEEFNINSRYQIVERLFELGLQSHLTERTPGGGFKVDETVLECIKHPLTGLMVEYLMLHKRLSQLAQWFAFLKDDGRVHGRVITNGAVTGRMTHMAPNMGQIPGCDAPFGKDCRALWCVPEGYRLVGADAAGLELRMLAHYMGDAAYTKEVVEGDVHTKNQLAVGLTARSQAKTFIYAFLYGAGSAKIGSIIGGGAREGQVMIEQFLDNTPALKRLREQVQQAKGSVKGLDGRRIRIRSAHAALNTLLQGAGAVVMKKAVVICADLLRRAQIPHRFVVNVHDEWQIETPAFYAETVGLLSVEAIKMAGKHYKLRCPLDGAYKVGNNWAETH